MTSTRGYHHGDLRRALVAAGLEQTRTGGPTALGLRQVTGRVGVSPSAAYRHFADRASLLRAVADEVTEKMAQRMREHLPSPAAGPAPDPAPDPGVRARDLLRAVGLGYVDFACAEPGWFEVAFFAARADEEPGESVTAREPAPYLLLVEAIDGLVDAGLVDPQQRQAALWTCWSTVHGFAELAVHGPLRHQPDPVVRSLAEAAVDGAIAGVTSSRTARTRTTSVAP